MSASPSTVTTPAPGGSAAPRRAPLLLVLVAFIALALNLRSPLTALSPVIGQLREALDMGPTLAGLLTSIPVLCFGLAAPLASLFIARAGVQAALLTAALGTAAGTLLRPMDGLAGAFGGTLLIGLALAIGNVVSLVVIARDFPSRKSVVTGIYTSAINVGTMLTSALTAPLALLLGWRFALAFWSVLAFLAAWLWWRVGAATPRPPAGQAQTLARPRPSAPGPSIWHRPVVWWLIVAFSGHLFMYYSLTAWLPTFLVEADHMDATHAGLAASAFQILALVGSFGVPWLANRYPLGQLLAAMGLLWLVTPIWMLLAPGQWYGWSLTGGITQGGAFVVIFMLVMAHARDLDDNRRISAGVQGVGYTLAATGPLVAGALHQATHGWFAPHLLLVIVGALIVAAGVAVTRLPAPVARD